MPESALYLTSVHPHLLSSGARRGNLANMGPAHRFVMSLFGDLGSEGSPRSDHGILFRYEREGKVPRILIQSRVRPEQRSGIRTVDASHLFDAFVPGQRCRMRLLVNPVRRASRSGSDKPVPDAETQEWIIDKLSAGFNILATHDLVRSTLKVDKQTIATALLEAEVEIAGHERAIELVSSGIGRRKSHGCGLVSVIPSAAVE